MRCSRRRSSVASSLSLTIVVTTVATAAADPATEAQRHIEAATTLHGQNKFAEASVELATAYALDPKPDLLYALGQVNVQLGNCGQAIVFYQRFLTTNPEAGPAGAATEAIETCKQTTKVLLEPKGESKRRVETATALHAGGQHEQARAELIVAYAIDPEPGVLFALGQLHVKLDQCDRAIPFYERYLTTNPDAVPAADTMQAIEVCKTKLANPGSLEPPPPPPPARTDGPAWYGDKLNLALAGGGVVLAVAGVAMYASARGQLDDAEAAPTYQEHVDLVDSAKSKRTTAVLLGTGGAALVGVAVVRFVLRDRDAERKVSAFSVQPRGDGALVTLGGSF